MSLQGKQPIGIDFGTSNSSVSMAAPEANGKEIPRTILLEGKEISPTVVFIPQEGQPLIGEDALDYGRHFPDRLYMEFKRNLDTTHQYLYTLNDGTSISANQLAGLVLQYLFDNAERNGGDSEQAVVCHPVGRAWQLIIEEIAKNLGKKVYTLSEPEAVLYYAHTVANVFYEKPEIVLLIDFGGGTCDFLLMKVKTSIWNGYLRPIPEIIDEDRLDFGGKDIDQLLVDEFVNCWADKYPKNIHLLNKFVDDPKLVWDLKTQAKDVKELLSRNYSKGIQDSIFIEMNNLPGNTKIKIELNPQKLHDLTTQLIRSSFFKLLIYEEKNSSHRPLLARKGIKPDDISMIILAGGSSQLPWVKDEILPELFPSPAKRKEIILLNRPEMAVSYGAALFAYDLYTKDKPKLPRFLFEDLRIEIEGGDTHILAEKGTKLPMDKDSLKSFHIFRFPKTGRLQIQLSAGEDNRAAKCRKLSYQPKDIEFEEMIPEGQLMQMRVHIDTKGEVRLYISKFGLPWVKRKPIELFFQALEITVKPTK
jgi:molecular chaperone DnaK